MQGGGFSGNFKPDLCKFEDKNKKLAITVNYRGKLITKLNIFYSLKM